MISGPVGIIAHSCRIAFNTMLIAALPLIGSAIGGNALIGSTSAVAAENSKKDSMKKTLVSQKLKLLERMMASKGIVKIRDGEDSRGKTLIEQAIAGVEKGKKALASDDLAEAERSLDLALRHISSARSAKAKSRKKPLKAQKRLFAELKSGIDSYLTSLISAESNKGENQPLQAVNTKIANLVNDADKLAAKNRYDDANKILDKAHRIAVTAVTKMRTNSTIVYSLKFANLGEEYEYENQRNESYKTLISMRKKSHGPSKRLAQQIGVLTTDSGRLRQQAEIRAGRKEYKEAIVLMEESTGKLISILRALGLSVPN